MHTCAHNPLPGTDLFGEVTEPTENWAAVDLASSPDMHAVVVVYSGTLARNAEVRVKPVGSEGNAAPVLCMELTRVDPTAKSVHAERVYPNNKRAEAEALAAQLRKGMHVVVSCPVSEARVSLPNVLQLDFTPATKP